MGGPGGAAPSGAVGKGAERTAPDSGEQRTVAELVGYLGGSPSGRKRSGDRRCRRREGAWRPRSGRCYLLQQRTPQIAQPAGAPATNGDPSRRWQCKNQDRSFQKYFKKNE